MVVALYGIQGGGNVIAANPTNQAPDFKLEGQKNKLS